MASGKPWQEWIDRAVACPPEWEFGTKVYIDGREFICQDRGGAIVYVNGIPWIDTLTENALYPFGSIIDVIVQE